MDHEYLHENESVKECCTEITRIINERLAQCHRQIETDIEEMEKHYQVGTIYKALIAANINGKLLR